MEKPKTIEQIDWKSYKSNDEIKQKLSELLREVMRGLSNELTSNEASNFVTNYIKERGVASVTVSISDVNTTGERTSMGMVWSPLDNDTIYF
ncbi:MAG: hypothetical protein WCG60_00455 [bacterium]|jgi:hypothetical protein